jgi:hypothetical protein
VRYRVQPWQLAALLLILCAAVLGIGFYFRYGSTYTTAELVAGLPGGEGTTIYIDVQTLRRSGILDLLAGSRVAEEADYKRFVEESGFDYREDLDAVLATFRGDAVYLLVRGRFDFTALKRYTEKQGGNCYNGFCRMPASKQERHISFRPLKRDLLAMAVSIDETAAWQVTYPKSGKQAADIPAQPVWVSLPDSALRDEATLPPGTRLFAKALEEAEKVTLALGWQDDRFEAVLQAACKNSSDAVVLHRQLEGITKVMRDYITRSNKTPNPRDLSGVLTAGQFKQQVRYVHGRWPIDRQFLEAISGGTL